MGNRFGYNKGKRGGRGSSNKFHHHPPIIRESSQPLTMHKSLPVKGRLQHFAEKWKEITTDEWVLETISQGLTLKFKTQPPLSPKPIPISLPKDTEKSELLFRKK